MVKKNIGYCASPVKLKYKGSVPTPTHLVLGVDSRSKTAGINNPM